MEHEEKSYPSKALKILLFWSNWIFIIFLNKLILSNPAGNLDFAFKAISSFFIAVILTGSMLHFLSVPIIRIAFLVMFISALILAII
jgi:hypothetical protein